MAPRSGVPKQKCIECIENDHLQSNLSKRPPVLSNHLPLKATISNPFKGKEVEIYLY